MPSDADRIRRALQDIQHHIRLAESFVATMAYADFVQDPRTILAVTRCLEIISEASRRLPDGFRAAHPETPWREMAAAGNIYRHEYEAVSAQRLWETVFVHLPPLRDMVERELMTLGDS